MQRATRVRDFGESPASRLWSNLTGLMWPAAGAAFFAIAAVMGLVEWQDAHHFDRAYTTQWTVSGPACPSVTAADVQALDLANHTPFAFASMRGSMASGIVSCTVLDLAEGRPTPPYTVCQFSAPFVIALTTPRGQVYFEPGVGRKATVSLRNGQPSCVMGAKLHDWGRVPEPVT